MKQSKLLIGIIGIAAALILLVIALLASEGGTGWMGGHMIDGDTGLTGTQLWITIAGSATLIASIAFLTYSHFSDRKSDEPRKAEEDLAPIRSEASLEPQNSTDQHLISRLLNGDERNLYQIIASSGGEIFQKDLVEKKVFSKAKVTRLLDKLEEKNLIVRERQGMTNRIKMVK
jgi:uncharacterized membrane protein